MDIPFLSASRGLGYIDGKDIVGSSGERAGSSFQHEQAGPDAGRAMKQSRWNLSRSWPNGRAPDARDAAAIARGRNIVLLDHRPAIPTNAGIRIASAHLNWLAAFAK